jgi:hypothetical protein
VARIRIGDSGLAAGLPDDDASPWHLSRNGGMIVDQSSEADPGGINCVRAGSTVTVGRPSGTGHRGGSVSGRMIA